MRYKRVSQARNSIDIYKIAYTIDAGPNVVVITDLINYQEVRAYMHELCQKCEGSTLEKSGYKKQSGFKVAELIETEVGEGVKLAVN